MGQQKKALDPLAGGNEGQSKQSVAGTYSEQAANATPFALPECLRPYIEERRFVGWRWEQRGGGKPTKPPRTVHGGKVGHFARNDDPSSWATLTEAMAALAGGGLDGIGFQLLDLKGFAAIDLDNVRDPDFETILPWAADLVQQSGSYTELTPSGKGLRILGAVDPSFPATHTKVTHPDGGEFELYVNLETGRYITVTGDRLPGAPDHLARVDATLQRLQRRPEQPDLPPQDGPTPSEVFNRLPQWLQEAVSQGKTGDRSADFQSAVNSLHNQGVSFNDALAMFAAHPNGPAGKYLPKRLEQELVRSWAKAMQSAQGQSGAANLKPAPGFVFVRASDLTYKPPEFLVDGLIETDTLGLLFGDPGHGKSFAAVDLALCVATGADFHGRDVKAGPVFFIAGEGHSGLVRRFHAWAQHRGIDIADAELFKSERAAQFLDAASAKAVADAVEELALFHGDPALIVIDTLARNFGGGDENSTQDMSAFIAAMDDLRAHWPGSCVLIVHHSGHNEKGRARGAMALKGALDFEYRLEKAGQTLTLTNTKMKDAEPPEAIFFELESVDLGGDAISAVLVEGNRPRAKEKPLTRNQEIAVQAYREAAGEHGIRDEEGFFMGVHRDAWRNAFYSIHTGDNDDSKRRTFSRARADLVEMGKFTMKDDVYSTTDVAVLFGIPTGEEREEEDEWKDVPF